MSNQYEVLGKAPGAEDLKNLSSEDKFFKSRAPGAFPKTSY